MEKYDQLTVFTSPRGQRMVDGPEFSVYGGVLANIWHLVINDRNDAAMILTNVTAASTGRMFQSAEFPVQSRVLANSSASITDTPRSSCSSSVEAPVNGMSIQ